MIFVISRFCVLLCEPLEPLGRFLCIVALFLIHIGLPWGVSLAALGRLGSLIGLCCFPCGLFCTFLGAQVVHVTTTALLAGGSWPCLAALGCSGLLRAHHPRPADVIPEPQSGPTERPASQSVIPDRLNATGDPQNVILDLQDVSPDLQNVLLDPQHVIPSFGFTPLFLLLPRTTFWIKVDDRISCSKFLIIACKINQRNNMSI